MFYLNACIVTHDKHVKRDTSQSMWHG